MIISSVTINQDKPEYKDELYAAWFKCPACDQVDIADGSNYCPNCGVKINWITSPTNSSK